MADTSSWRGHSTLIGQNFKLRHYPKKPSLDSRPDPGNLALLYLTYPGGVIGSSP